MQTKTYTFVEIKMNVFMKHQTKEQHQTKIISLPVTKKRPFTFTFTKIVLIFLFGFFITLSITSNNLFLKEILIGTAIIGFALALKQTNTGHL